MPHMHLPIQSGSDSVLRRMARRCKTAEFSRVVEKARSEIPLFNVTTDVIVGFPGETEQEWQQTLDYVERTGFGHMHIFTYSRREGTKAAGLPGQIDRATKKVRSRQMHQLVAQLKERELEKHLGKEYPVLWEQEINRGARLWSGYTPHYHKIISNVAGIRAAEIRNVEVDQVSVDGIALINNSRRSNVAISLCSSFLPLRVSCEY